MQQKALRELSLSCQSLPDWLTGIHITGKCFLTSNILPFPFVHRLSPDESMTRSDKVTEKAYKLISYQCCRSWWGLVWTLLWWRRVPVQFSSEMSPGGLQSGARTTQQLRNNFYCNFWGKRISSHMKTTFYFWPLAFGLWPHTTTTTFSLAFYCKAVFFS